MADPRNAALAELLVDRCLDVQPGWQVTVRSSPLARPLVTEVARRIARRGAYYLPRINWGTERILADLDWALEAPLEVLAELPPIERHQVETEDARLTIRAPEDVHAGNRLDEERRTLLQKAAEPSSRRARALEVRWAVVEYPTEAAAAEAGMSLPEYTEFVYGACLLDWDAEEERMRAIKERFDRAERVRIVGDGTDLTLSIRGRDGVVSAGFRNMPDGEVFYCPVEDSAEGVITSRSTRRCTSATTSSARGSSSARAGSSSRVRRGARSSWSRCCAPTTARAGSASSASAVTPGSRGSPATCSSTRRSRAPFISPSAAATRTRAAKRERRALGHGQGSASRRRALGGRRARAARRRLADLTRRLNRSPGRLRKRGASSHSKGGSRHACSHHHPQRRRHAGRRAARPARRRRAGGKDRSHQRRFALGAQSRLLFATDNAGNLLRFREHSPWLVRSKQITGLPAGVSLKGIDFRPATGDLYALGSDRVVYRVNPQTAIAVAEGPAFEAMPTALTGDKIGFDFNPTVDKIRITSDADENFRLDPDPGSLLANDTKLTPADVTVVGSAYTNSSFVAFANRPATTMLFAYDTSGSGDRIWLQNPANAGTLMNPLSTGSISARTSASTSPGRTTAATSPARPPARAGGAQLYSVDLGSGRARTLGRIGDGNVVVTGLAAWQDQ